MDLVNQRQGADSRTPHILSLTNVAVSKQKALLHATAATHVQEACTSSAASEIRQHALDILADSGPQASSQPQLSAAMASSAAQVTIWLFQMLGNKLFLYRTGLPGH